MISHDLVGVIGFCLFFILIFLNMPIGLVMGLIGFVGFSVIRGFDSGLSVVGMQISRTISDPNLGVIPLFIAMGFLAARVGLSTNLFYAMNKWIGHWRGGLAMASTGACTIFAAICGDPIASAGAMGIIAIPEMRKYKYKDILSTGCIAAGGNLGFLIPPSLAFILYGILTEQAIGTLFIAGVLPGLLLASIFIIIIWGWCRIDPKVAPASTPTSWREKFAASQYVIGALIVILLVLGGIYGGIFTPTEAAAIGVFGILIIGSINRGLTWQNFIAGISDTALLTGNIFILIIGAFIFIRFVTVSEMALHLAEIITNLQLGPNTVLVIVLIFYIIIGFIMDVVPIIMITVPTLHPMLVGLGFDPVWLAVIVVITILMGGISPPVGIVVYALSGMVKDVPMFTIFRGALPFLGGMLVCLIILIFFPQIVLFLPNLMKPFSLK